MRPRRLDGVAGRFTTAARAGASLASARAIVANDFRMASTSLLTDRRRILGKRHLQAVMTAGSYYALAVAPAPQRVASQGGGKTGGLRRTHLRGHPNILKRLLIHSGAFNLGLLLRRLVGTGTPRGLQGRLRAPLALLSDPAATEA